MRGTRGMTSVTIKTSNFVKNTFREKSDARDARDDISHETIDTKNILGDANSICPEYFFYLGGMHNTLTLS